MTSDQSRFDLAVDIFGDVQQALVLHGLAPTDLVRSIIQEFREVDHLLSDPAAYKLVRSDTEADLDDDRPLDKQLAPRTQIKLVERPLQAPSGAQPLGRQIYLREQSRNTVYLIGWQPAIIGRVDANVLQNELVAVDLSGYTGELLVSRRHAQIVARGTQVVLENLSSNPTRITRADGSSTDLKGQHQIQHDDLIELVRSQIKLRVIIRPNP